MAKTTVLFGIILIILGAVGYSGGGSAAPAETAPETDTADAAATDDAEKPKKSSRVTALIPAGFGAGLLICGLLAFKESRVKHAMHGAATFGLIGALAGAVRGGMGLGKFFSGDPSLNQRSFLFVWLMAIICGVFVFLCVRSFINARKAREAAAASGGA